MLEGARRIGKSTIVEEFAKNEYEDYLILDFARESKEIKKKCAGDFDSLGGVSAENVSDGFRGIFVGRRRQNYDTCDSGRL